MAKLANGGMHDDAKFGIRTPVVGGQKRRRPSGRPFRFGPGVSSPLPSTGKPVLADTSGVGNSDLVGHPSRPSLASHSRPCSLPRGRRDFRPRACNRPGRARNTDRDGRPCAAPKRALPVRKLTEQHHLKARFLTFVSPLGVPRVRVKDSSVPRADVQFEKRIPVPTLVPEIASNSCDDLEICSRLGDVLGDRLRGLTIWGLPIQYGSRRIFSISISISVPSGSNEQNGHIGRGRPERSSTKRSIFTDGQRHAWNSGAWIYPGHAACA